MNLIQYKKNVNKISDFLVLALFFVLPISVVASNTISTLLLILYLVSGDYRKKIESIKNNRVSVAVLLFF